MWEKHPGVRFAAEIGSVQNQRRLAEVFAKCRSAAVLHAAPYELLERMITGRVERVGAAQYGGGAGTGHKRRAWPIKKLGGGGGS